LFAKRHRSASRSLRRIPCGARKAPEDTSVLDSHYEHINCLVRRAKGGSGIALAEIAAFYQPLIRASLRRCAARDLRLGRYRDDLEAEAILVVSDLVRQYDPELSYFSYYLSTRIDYALMTRARRLYLAQNGAGAGIDEVCFSDMPAMWQPESNDDPFGRAEQARIVREAMSRLTESQRDALELVYFHDMTQEDASKVVGITQSAFCKRLQRALHRMRSLLADGTDDWRRAD
jgi:RNA polymerase sigma factor (sigma-70 family)